ncbi:hypothetical protein OE88DRAFT_657194 [Heliocybe sulcata]|uniref:Uncharacterized protein n=1 Tax=Heliocybe sulcata TaxID=5364 RepID=A0A5C3NEK6_9AGAM|nr:hypothetical protein OE88DRAFT_657194 [Heliocybe sulcata]
MAETGMAVQDTIEEHAMNSPVIPLLRPKVRKACSECRRSKSKVRTNSAAPFVRLTNSAFSASKLNGLANDASRGDWTATCLQLIPEGTATLPHIQRAAPGRCTVRYRAPSSQPLGSPCHHLLLRIPSLPRQPRQCIRPYPHIPKIASRCSRPITLSPWWTAPR